MKKIHVIGETKNQPERIISLASSLTEILFFLGLEQKVVGVTDNAATLKTANSNKVGTFTRPDFATMHRLEPDLIITMAKTYGLFPQLFREMNVPVMVMDYKNLAGIFDSMEEIARFAGAENGKDMVDTLRKRVREAAPQDGSPRPRVYRLLIRPTMAPTASSYQFDAIRLAGGEPFPLESANAYDLVNPADIFAFDPDVILSCGRNSDNQEPRRCPGCKRPDPPCMRVVSEISQWVGWENTAAARNQRVYAIPCELLCHPGPKLVDGIEWMSKIFRDAGKS